jgi:hypothetical protein
MWYSLSNFFTSFLHIWFIDYLGDEESIYMVKFDQNSIDLELRGFQQTRSKLPK